MEDQLRRELAKVHKILRDTDGNSSLLERFDETTKLLFLKILSERENQTDLFNEFFEDASRYANRIKKHFAAACAKAKAYIPPRFRELHLSDEAISRIGQVLRLINISASKADLKGIAYEEMLRNTFEKGDNQQFFTPRPITSFLVNLMHPFLKGNVCDPASGTGGFLVEILKHGIYPKHIWGFEVDERLAWVTGVNLYLNGANAFESVFFGNGGSLGSKGHEFFGQFHAIITNPPFGSDYSDAQELGRTPLERGYLPDAEAFCLLSGVCKCLKTVGTLVSSLMRGSFRYRPLQMSESSFWKTQTFWR